MGDQKTEAEVEKPAGTWFGITPNLDAIVTGRNVQVFGR